MNVEKRANGGAMRLDRASLPVIGDNLLWDHPELLSQMHNDDRRDVLFLIGKASLILEILQQTGRAE